MNGKVAATVMGDQSTDITPIPHRMNDEMFQVLSSAINVGLNSSHLHNVILDDLCTICTKSVTTDIYGKIPHQSGFSSYNIIWKAQTYFIPQYLFVRPWSIKFYNRYMPGPQVGSTKDLYICLNGKNVDDNKDWNSVSIESLFDKPMYQKPFMVDGDGVQELFGFPIYNDDPGNEAVQEQGDPVLESELEPEGCLSEIQCLESELQCPWIRWMTI